MKNIIANQTTNYLAIYIGLCEGGDNVLTVTVNQTQELGAIFCFKNEHRNQNGVPYIQCSHNKKIKEQNSVELFPKSNGHIRIQI